MFFATWESNGGGKGQVALDYRYIKTYLSMDGWNIEMRLWCKSTAAQTIEDYRATKRTARLAS
jgi:hypothetical protein